MTVCFLCTGPLRPEAGGALLCRPCRADLPRIPAACQRCGRRLGSPGVCGACLVRPPLFDRAVAGFGYEPPVDAIIREFKYRGHLYWARFLAMELAEAVAAAGPWDPDCLVPVPLHWRRHSLRGFNQATEIARHLGHALHVDLAPALVRRRRWSASQAGLSAVERRKNVRGAFAFTGLRIYESVAVVDDVMTTGATASELARVLKEAGARRVEVWTAARAHM